MESTDDHIILGQRHVYGGEQPFSLSAAERRQHLYVLGQTGVGKSTLLRNLIIQDIQAGKGVGFIDLHGDLALEVLDNIPPRRARDVVYFDPAGPRPLAMNLLLAITDDWYLAATGIVSAFKKIWGDAWGPRLQYVFTAAVAALLQCENTSLLGVSRMLYDDRYRAWVVKQIKDPIVRSFWVHEFPAYDKAHRQEVVGPIQTRLGQLMMSPALRNCLGQVATKVNFRFMMDRKRIFIANLSKGRIGETASSLLGALLVTGFELAAQSRTNIAPEKREEFFLTVDEFQNCATDSFAGILSEARKYRLSLTLAHQYAGQLDEKLRDAIFGNVGTLVSFRVSETDAAILERQFGGVVLASQFTSLNNYEYYAKMLNKEPFIAKSFPAIDLGRRERKGIMKRSAKKYGRKRSVVEKKIEKWLE